MKMIAQFLAVLFLWVLGCDTSMAQRMTNDKTHLALPKGCKHKTVKSKSVDYVIEGIFCKKELVQEQNVVVLDNSSRDTIISGRYFVENNKAFIDGVWKRNENDMPLVSNGIFKIENTSDNRFSVKSKEMSKLKVATIDLFKFSGYRYGNASVTVYKTIRNGMTGYTLYIDNMECIGAGTFKSIETSFSVDQLVESGYYDIDSILKQAENVKFQYKDGVLFSGKIENHYISGGNMDACVLKEGRKSYSKSYGNVYSDELVNVDGGVKLIRTLSSDDKMEINVSQDIIADYGYWSVDEYMLNTTDIRYVYKNGDVYVGKKQSFRNAEGAVVTELTDGTYTYRSGETYIGKMNGKWFGGVPVEGTMTFNDGKQMSGNWLAEYDLSAEQIESITSICRFPDEKLNMAIQFFYSNKYCEAEQNAVKALENKEFALAKNESLRGQHYASQITDSSMKVSTKVVDGILAELDKRERLLRKYGAYWGKRVYQKELTAGMTKEMVCDMLDERVYDKEKYGGRMEEWKFNSFKYSQYNNMDDKNTLSEVAVQAILNISNFILKDPKELYPDTISFVDGKLEAFEFKASDSVGTALGTMLLLDLLF